MKKLLMALAFVASGMIFANAQTTAPAGSAKPAKAAPAQEKKMDAAKPAPAKDVKPAVQSSEKKQEVKKADDGIVLKKDGTPDKRYKAKEAKGPMKKDGTPDMRHKANKDAKKAAK